MYTHKNQFINLGFPPTIPGNVNKRFANGCGVRDMKCKNSIQSFITSLLRNNRPSTLRNISALIRLRYFLSLPNLYNLSTNYFTQAVEGAKWFLLKKEICQLPKSFYKHLQMVL